jgi:hypothetical protein
MGFHQMGIEFTSVPSQSKIRASIPSSTALLILAERRTPNEVVNPHFRELGRV